MQPDQWENFKRAAVGQSHDSVPLALIVDSPWIPGFHVLNWGKQLSVSDARKVVGDRLCLMGNVNPLEIGVRGTPGQVREETLRVLENSGGNRFILSVGGGVSPGMPGENIRAMITALEEYNAHRNHQAPTDSEQCVEG